MPPGTIAYEWEYIARALVAAWGCPEGVASPLATFLRRRRRDPPLPLDHVLAGEGHEVQIPEGTPLFHLGRERTLSARDLVGLPHVSEQPQVIAPDVKSEILQSVIPVLQHMESLHESGLWPAGLEIVALRLIPAREGQWKAEFILGSRVQAGPPSVPDERDTIASIAQSLRTSFPSISFKTSPLQGGAASSPSTLIPVAIKGRPLPLSLAESMVEDLLSRGQMAEQKRSAGSR